MKSESSLETIENIVTKGRKERVKLQKTRQALDCGGRKQRRLRRERERERDERRRLLLLTC